VPAASYKGDYMLGVAEDRGVFDKLKHQPVAQSWEGKMERRKRA